MPSTPFHLSKGLKNFRHLELGDRLLTELPVGKIEQPQLLLPRGRRIAFCLEFFDQFVGTGLVLTAVTIRRCAIVESKSAGGAAKAELVVIGGSEGNCSAGAMIDFAELDACNSGR